MSGPRDGIFFIDESRSYNYGFCGKNRKVEVVVGLRYEIRPLNKLKNVKNQGRVCMVLGFRDYESCGQHRSERARVRWIDNRRIGFVDPKDLVPADND